MKVISHFYRSGIYFSNACNTFATNNMALKEVLLLVVVGIAYIPLHIVAGADIDVGPSTAVSASVGTSISLWCKVNTWTTGLSSEWVRVFVGSASLLTQDCLTVNTTKYNVNPCDQINHNYTLVISNVQFSDAGIYVCTHSGRSSERVILLVIAAPQGTRLLNSTANLKVKAQQDTTFLCETKAYPAATVTWEIDVTAVTSGVTHSNSPRDVTTQLITTTSTLKYMFQKIQGSKTVTCKASNSASGSTPAVVSVNVDIIWPVESVSVNCTNSTLHLEGGTVYCQCQTVGGNPAGMVKWTDVTARPSPYVLPIVATRANTIFKCEGFNDVNTNRPSTAIQLNVAYPPNNVGITSNPEAPLLAGSTSTLTCEASDKGNPEPNYRWWNSSNNDITDTESAGKSVITVGPLTDRDNGQIYHCETSNYYTINKPSTSPTAAYTLNVEFNPIISTRASLSSTVKEGEDVTLTCDVTKANPTVTSYVWSRTRDRTNGVHNQASYTINQIQVEQNGTYTCYATAQSSRHGNLIGESSVTLTVQYRPTVTVTLKSNPVTVTEGDDVTFQCAARGSPPVYTDYKWAHVTFGSPETELVSTGRELVLSRVTYLDNGEYICVVRNSVGQGLGRKRLDVLYSPRTTVESRIVAASIGEPVTLSISVTANPANASFTWKKSDGDKRVPVVGGIVLTDPISLKSKLFIPSVQGSDYGQYVCTVSHTVASREFTFEIRPKGPPERPTDFRISSWTSVSVTLTWVSGFNGGSNQSFHIQYKETSRTRWQRDDELVFPDPGYMKTAKAKVPDLNPVTSYDFRLVSINKHPSTNSSGFTGAFTQKTKARPSVLDDKLSVSITPTVAIVSWTISSGIEDITSYVVKYCEKDTVVCNRHKVANSTATSAVITLDEGFQDYTFSLLIYEEDDLVKVIDQPISEPSPVQLQVGVIVGIVVAVLVLLILAVITAIVIRRFRKSKRGRDVPDRDTAATGGMHEMKDLNSQPLGRHPATESSIYDVPDHQVNQAPIYTDLQPHNALR